MNILTSFPFTFKLTVPGLSNPFTSLATNPPSPTTSKSRPAPTKTVEVEHNAEHRARPLVRPTRPLPISVAPLSPSRSLRPSMQALSTSPSSTSSASLSMAHGYSHLAPRRLFATPHSPSPGPVNRKRGWEPSVSPSPSETTLASTNGYLDAPARYRDLAGQNGVEIEYVDGRSLGEDDLPPAKRRRGLADSIVSTAWSAALIGSAVGLTVYKLWRNRGNPEDDSDCIDDDSKMRGLVVEDVDGTPEPPSPPPPYNHEWTSIDYLQHQPSYLRPSLSHQQQMHHQEHLVTPRSKGKQKVAITPKSQRKTTVRTTKRAVAKSTGRIGTATRSRPPIPSQFDFEATAAAPSPAKRARSAYEPSYASSSSSYDPTPPTNDVGMGDPEEEDDEMDWIGGKLAQLIEEGKKALGKEVVVMSEAKEDEEDDCSGAWVSDDDCGFPGALGGGKKRTGSVRSRTGRRSTISSGDGGAYGHASGPGLSLPTTPDRTRGMTFDATGSVSSSPSSTSVLKEQEQFESPEVREMMEKARAKIAARLGRA